MPPLDPAGQDRHAVDRFMQLLPTIGERVAVVEADVRNINRDLGALRRENREQHGAVEAKLNVLHEAVTEMKGREAGKDGLVRLFLERWLVVLTFLGVLCTACGGVSGLKHFLSP